MRVHVTEKLEKAGYDIASGLDTQSTELGEWHANITTIQRRQCIVFTHDATRFTIALIGITQKELKNLDYWFEDMLANSMLKLGYDDQLIRKACGSIGQLSFDTQCSRSVQGTLRLMIGDLEAYTWDGSDILELGPYSLSAELCNHPCNVKGMKKSQCLWPARKMRQLLQALPKPSDTLQ